MTLREYDAGRAKPGSRVALRFPRQQAMDGQRLPHLTQLFALVRQLGYTRVKFHIEIKLSPHDGSLYACPNEMAAQAAAAVRAAGADARTTIQGFD